MSDFTHLKTISNLFKLFEPGHPVQHPLIGIIDFSKINGHISSQTKISADFYSLIFKNYPKNNIKYGRKIVDFQDGSLICMAPNQVIEMDEEGPGSESLVGWGLFFHPDLIRTASLGIKIKEYHFFSYETSEALHLSEKEKQILNDLLLKIEKELQENIDVHSQDIITSNIELLLNYCSRFYARQFITRKTSNNVVVTQIEKLLTEYFNGDDIDKNGLPTVKNLAETVNLSASYLSDLLKKETGKNTQEHIHFYLIEQAKNILLNTSHSVSEIAYSLGFEYPQYFNKLFKKKTGSTPIEFRNMN